MQTKSPHQKIQGFLLAELLMLCVLLLGLGLIGWRVYQRIKGAPAQTAKPAVSVQPVAAKGVSLSPKGFGAADFSDFFTVAPQAGGLISWTGGWTQLSNKQSAPYVLAGLAAAKNFQPVIIVGTHSGTDEQPVAPLTDQNKQQFVSLLSDFAATYKPAYLGIGNEVNRIYDKHPGDYATFVSWFQAATDAVKQKSPHTKVQYEQLNGLYGGLFGGVNDPNKSHWQLLSDFASADLLAFTTYPYLVYSSPSDIPADYYARLPSHTAKPVAFTEIGWPSTAETPSRPSSEQTQADFVTTFAKLAAPLPPAFVLWPFLYDQHLAQPFASLNLLGESGPKQAYEVWRATSF